MPTPPFVTPPEAVRPVYVQTPRGTFAALAASATGESGRTALLVPGYTGSKENLIALLGPLAQAGHQAVAIDLRGQYETPGPDDPSAYTIEELGADVAAVLDVLESGPVHLLGHSLGGLVVRETAMLCPERLESLTLLSSGPGAVGGASAERVRALLAALPEMSMEGIWAAMEDRNAREWAVDDRTPEIVDFQRRRFLHSSPTGLAAMGDALVNVPDRVDALAGAVSCPVLVAYGDDDDVWSPQEQATMADRLGARRAVLPRGGHNPAADATEATVRVLAEFWAHAEDPEPHAAPTSPTSGASTYRASTSGTPISRTSGTSGTSGTYRVSGSSTGSPSHEFRGAYRSRPSGHWRI